MADIEEVKKILDSHDEEFHQLSQEHTSYEARLAILARKSTLSPEEEVEEKTLKKRKLYLKDRMFEKIRGFAEAQVS